MIKSNDTEDSFKQYIESILPSSNTLAQSLAEDDDDDDDAENISVTLRLK